MVFKWQFATSTHWKTDILLIGVFASRVFWNFAGCFKISIREGRKCSLHLKLFTFEITGFFSVDIQFEMLEQLSRIWPLWFELRGSRWKISEFILSTITKPSCSHQAAPVSGDPSSRVWDVFQTLRVIAHGGNLISCSLKQTLDLNFDVSTCTSCFSCAKNPVQLSGEKRMLLVRQVLHHIYNSKL